MIIKMSFISRILAEAEKEGNPLRKHLKRVICNLTDEDLHELDRLSSFFKSFDIDVKEQYRAYQEFVDMTLGETKYFLENGNYRYSTFSEVADKVYFCNEYMKRYMVGLSLSQYLWDIHKNCHNFFLDKLHSEAVGGKYCEIGPGHGLYFYDAVYSKKFSSCTAIDLSHMSLTMTKAFVNYPHMYSGNVNVEYIYKDVNSIAGEALYDFLVMCEVLEHVEEPEKILRSLRRILKKDGMAYFSIPINAPAIDHIKLFKSPDEVIALLNNTGFVIKEQKLFCSNGNKLERALKFNEPILMCVFVA